MSSTQWKRARKPAQKAERREAILEAAKRLFAEKSYEEVSLNSIARESGMSKPNVYRYFSSREEIFLQILAEEHDRFTAGISAKLDHADKTCPVDEIVRIWVEESQLNTNLMILLPQLGSSLEKNSSVEQLVPFKKRGFQQIAELAEKHNKLYPSLSVETWGEVISCTVALLAGMWPLCNGGDVVEQAMAHPEVNLPAWDFAEKMTFSLKALILGVGRG